MLEKENLFQSTYLTLKKNFSKKYRKMGIRIEKKVTGTAQSFMEAGPEHLTWSKKSF